MASGRIPIGRFSLITRIPEKALRCYDSRGILVPSAKETLTGYRYYTQDQIAQGVMVRTLQGLGFPPTEIGVILAARERRDGEAIREVFSRRSDKVRSEIVRLQKIGAFLERQEAPLELIYMSLAEPVEKDVPPLRVIARRAKGIYSETITLLIQGLCTELSASANQPPAVSITGPFMSIYHDEECREKDADIECAVPITGKITVSDPQTFVRIVPGGRILSLVYRGPYAGIHEGWSRIFTWIDEKGYQISGPGREVYLNDPCEVPEEDLLTEIQVPVSGGPGRRKE